jgi:hypothetical protein
MSKRIDKKFPKTIYVTRDEASPDESYLNAAETEADIGEERDGEEVAIYQRCVIHILRVTKTLD